MSGGSKTGYAHLGSIFKNKYMQKCLLELRRVRVAALASTLLWNASLLSSVYAKETAVDFAVSGAALSMSGDNGSPPDEGGGFAISVLWKETPIEAMSCFGKYMLITMPSDHISGQRTEKEIALVARKLKYFKNLKGAVSSHSIVEIHIKTTEKYLRWAKGGALVAPYCSITFNGQEF